MNWRLIVDRGSRKGQVIPLARNPFLIGRDASCNLRPAAASVAGRHCVLVVHRGNLFVTREDGDAFVNGRRVEGQQQLHSGDRLGVGPLEFAIDLSDTPPRPQRRPLDEDAVAEMLLAMDAEENAVPNHESTPSGATVSEGKALAVQDTQADQKAIAGQSQAAPGAAPARGETRQAAEDLLERYVRRPEATNRFSKS